MAGLSPSEYVNQMKFSATNVLKQHMDPHSFEATWDKFVLSANKWLTEQGLKEYGQIHLANMRGGQGSATTKILSDLGHKGCRVADLVGILQDAEMYDILRAEEFKLLVPPSKAGMTTDPYCERTISSKTMHCLGGGDRRLLNISMLAIHLHVCMSRRRQGP